MTVTVKFFARMREIVKHNEASIGYRKNMTVADIWQQTTDGVAMPGNTLMAVNLEYVDAGHLVQDGDEVAFFPPVTGG